MKKATLLLSIILMLSGCTSGSNTESSVDTSKTPAEIPQQISVQKDIGELLESTFMELWKSDTVDIEVSMTVEGKEKSSGKQVYQYRVAGSKKNKSAMLEMEEPDGKKVHYIINADKIYNINDSEKTYTVSEYKKTVDSFIKAYTTDMNLGMSESLKIADSGTADFEDNKPYAEVMQSDRGKTTFTFKKVSDTIKDENILKVSKDHSEK